ncbi:hypothetical protein RDI58_021584 [Solanum bulbocastanum]|uniref:Uncharacterized protein n=1 Tax=Solanum bulbocastanum TaxID=147425 RepID=A0AAN8T2R1_SOLBU
MADSHAKNAPPPLFLLPLPNFPLHLPLPLPLLMFARRLHQLLTLRS